MAVTPPEKKRYIGIDILRIFFILPTIMLHVWNIIFSENHVSFSSAQSLYPFYENVIARLLGYSGVFIFCLSFFLYGIRRHSLFQLKPLHEYFKLALLIGAMISTQFNDSMNPQDSDFFIWDIFSFVLISYLLISLMALIQNEKFLLALLGAGVALFLVPVSVYSQGLEGLFVGTVEPIFMATQTSFGHNGWFLLPWIGLPLIFYPLGRVFSKSYPAKNLFLFPLAVGSLLLMISPEKIPPALGSLFYQYIFWQSPGYILARLMIFSGVVLWLCQREWSRGWKFFSYLQWNKNFWFCYIIHFGFIDLLSDHKDFFSQNLFYLDWLWLGLFVGVEILAQLFFLMTRIYLWISKKALASLRRSFRS